MWWPEHTISCYGCEKVERYHLGQGHVPPTWKMVKAEGRYRAFCASCLAAMTAEATASSGHRSNVVFVPRREFRARRRG